MIYCLTVAGLLVVGLIVFWLLQVIKRFLIQKIDDNGKVGPQIYVQKTRLDSFKEMIPLLLAGLIGMGVGVIIGGIR